MLQQDCYLSDHKLHIIAFDIPYPADYGGAIDVFYKIRALSRAGCEIYLHCYEYGRQHSAELNKWCKQVWYYPRLTGLKGISAKWPYIIYSRRNNTLLQRLIDIDAPILFEGIHTTYYLSHPALQNRYKAIRNHNVEHDYYYHLYQKEKNIFKKAYYRAESILLKQQELQMNNAQAFFSLSQEDDTFFANAYPLRTHAFIPAFHPYDEVTIKEGTGTYCLYHGNLSHPENQEAALYLLKEVFPKVDMPFTIAGRNPSQEIIDSCKKLPNGKLVINPSQEEMATLIADAHIHTLPTFQNTGVKLKLLYALFNGRHVLANSNMMHGTGLKDVCSIENNTVGFAAQLQQLMTIPFTQADIQKRAAGLIKYNNLSNAAQLLTYLPQISL